MRNCSTSPRQLEGVQTGAYKKRKTFLATQHATIESKNHQRSLVSPPKTEDDDHEMRWDAKIKKDTGYKQYYVKYEQNRQKRGTKVSKMHDEEV
jgi:hypothetical protein